MTVLVTGAAGFIGLHLVHHLAAEGHAVRALVHNETPSLPAGQIVCIKGDVTDPVAMNAAVEGVDSVFHLAAARDRWGLPESVYYRTNVEGTRCLLRAAIQAGVRRFVHCSSVGVARYPGNLEADESLPYSHPASQVAYHETKATAERDALATARAGWAPVLVVRPTIAYGPGDRTGMVTQLLDRLAQRRFLPVGNGRNHLHLVYIDDLVQGMILAWQRGTLGRVYILSGPRATTLQELVGAACGALDSASPGRIYVPARLATLLARCAELAWSAAGRRPPVTRDAVATLTVDRGFSHARASQELGYHPGVDYAEGLARTVAWARASARFD